MKKLETVYSVVYALPEKHPFLSLLVGSILLGTCLALVYAIYWLTIAIMLDVADKVSGVVHVNVMCVLTFECLALSAYLYKRIAKII